FSLSACSVTKKVDHMVDTTDRVEQNAGHMDKTTDYVYGDLTYKDSYDMVLKNMLLLYGQEATRTQGAQSNPEAPRLVDAGAGLESLYFQCWKSEFGVKDLDARLEVSLEMLIVQALGHIPRTFKVDVMNPDRDYEAVATLGAKLDRERGLYADN